MPYVVFDSNKGTDVSVYCTCLLEHYPRRLLLVSQKYKQNLLVIFIPTLFLLKRGGIVIASSHPSVCLSVHQSVLHAISYKTIGQNPTNFGVSVTHMNGALILYICKVRMNLN